MELQTRELVEVKHGVSNRLNHAVNHSAGVVCGTTRSLAWNKKGERKLENKNSNKSMLPEEQEPGQELILQKKDMSYQAPDNPWTQRNKRM